MLHFSQGDQVLVRSVAEITVRCQTFVVDAECRKRRRKKNSIKMQICSRRIGKQTQLDPVYSTFEQLMHNGVLNFSVDFFEVMFSEKLTY